MALLSGVAKPGWGWLILGLILTGCQPPQTDAPGQAARLTGIEGAISFHESREASPAPVIEGGTLKLDQAVRLALWQDPRIAAALARVRGAEADARQSRLLPNPILSFDIRFPEGGGQPITEVIPIEDLIAILQKPSAISAADNRLRETASDAMTTVLDVVSEVEGAYATAQSSDAEIAAAQERMKAAEKLRDLAKSRLSAGEGARLDVLTTESQRLQAVADLSDLRLARLEPRLKLARLVGQARGKADWTLEPWRSAPAPKGSEAAWIDAALANRPEIVSKLWELRALGDDVSLANLSELQGDMIGGYGEHDQTWSVGPMLTIPIPIFDMGNETRAKAVAQQRAARQDLAQQSLEVIEEVRLAYATYTASLDALTQAQTQLLPIQEQQRQQAEESYKSGDTDLTTLLQAESDLEQTRSKVAELEEKATVALVQLHRAVGGAGIAATVADSTQPAGPTSQAVQAGTSP
jgi:cobalt-zinc-cadmium efflux system outer membrane protein